MQTTTITVAAIEWPAAGKKLGAIIDNSGQRWGVWPDKLPGYQQGRSYEIGYESSDFKGRTYYTVKTATPVSGGIPGLIIPMPPALESRPVSNEDNQRRMDIFVSVLINNSKFDPASASEQEVVDVINKFKNIWKRVYGPQAQETLPKGALNKELNDEVPF